MRQEMEIGDKIIGVVGEWRDREFVVLDFELEQRKFDIGPEQIIKIFDDKSKNSVWTNASKFLKKKDLPQPPLDFQSISRYIRWNHNRDWDNSVSENQFIQAWGQQMGTHYWQKYFRTFNSDIFQMVAYFRGETENGELFIGMVNDCIARYESRLNKVFISK